MIQRNEIEAEIYRRYIAPTKGKRQQYIGVEFEMPLVNLERKAVDFGVIHSLVDAFADTFHFQTFKYDDEGNICAAVENVTGDDLSFDCSYNTLEFSFGREDDLTAVEKRFHQYYQFVSDFLQGRGHRITGMGINPYYQFNDIVPVPNGRYRMLLHHLKSYEKYADQMLFHQVPYYGLIACSSQTHLDVEQEALPRTINLFNRLEPLKALLFANSPAAISPVTSKSYADSLCVRDHLWRESMHGLNPHNVDGWHVELGSIDELAAYIRSMSLYCTEREGQYINFPPTPLEDYFAREEMTGEYYDGEGYREISWKPGLEDLQYLRSFKFVDLTFRGTLEMRSTCMQPAAEAMTVPAFHLGIRQKLDQLEHLLEGASIYHQGYTPVELRKLFVGRDLPAFADPEELKILLVAIVKLARQGLQERGRGEERLLDPLLERAAALRSPARELLEGLEAGRSLESYITAYGTLEV